jgi:hypothetical protein
VTDDRALELDDVDRAIVVFVHRYRAEHHRGPLWREVRDAVGIPRLDLGTDALLAWWDAQPPDRYLSRMAAQRAFKQVVRNADPLPARLLALRWAGYVRFNKTERSLNVGPRIRAWQESRRGA